MPKICPFNYGKKCGKPKGSCEDCDIRRRAGQRMLIPEPKRPETPTVAFEVVAREFTCPYCLYTGQLPEFQIRLRKGKISGKRFACPDCGCIMRRDTIMKKMSIEEFAQWMYNTMPWERVSWEKFRTRLKETGISYQFWAEYNRLKQEASEDKATTSYEEYVRQEQESKQG